MHGLPSDFDFSALRGQRLQQACISLYQIILRFEEDLTVGIEGAIEIEADQDSYRGQDYRAAAALFGVLLERSIKDAVASNDKELRITFDNGAQLTLYDNEEHYESFQIEFRGRRFAV